MRQKKEEKVHTVAVVLTIHMGIVYSLIGVTE